MLSQRTLKVHPIAGRCRRRIEVLALNGRDADYPRVGGTGDSMKIPDETLSAFVNGELEGAERQRIEQAIARDRRIAQRVAKHRALRGRLDSAFDIVLRQPARAPREAARKLTPGSAQIIDLARVRAERARAGRSRRAPRSSRFAIAAALTVGLATGALFAHLNAAGALTQYENGKLSARGALARALNEQIVGQVAASAKIRIVSTYRMKTGNYCRSFTVASAQSMMGLACRSRDQWQLQSLLTGSTAPALQLELSKNANGAALSPAAETQLRARDWQ